MNFKFYYKIIVISAILSFHGAASFAQKGFFKPVSNARMDLTKMKNIQKFSTYTIRTSDLRSYLLQAPVEFKDKAAKPLELEIPLPNGETEIFNLFETSTLSRELAAKHPEIKTYTGNGTVNPKAIISINLSSSGFNALILNVNDDAVYFEKFQGSDSETYFNYFSKDATATKNGILPGGSGGHDVKGTPKIKKADGAKSGLESSRTSATGTTLTTYRLAFAADGEFTTLHGGNIPANVVSTTYNTLVAYVARVNLFYRQELSINFTLVTGEEFVFTDPATDPYTNSDQELMLNENQAKMDAVVKTPNYDIGHVMGYFPGTSGGGLAQVQALCDPLTKAQGASNEGGDAYAQSFYDKLIFHELGHQVGMTHSYNSSIPVCTSREIDTSVEPGAGTTVMSYAMICAGDGNLGDDYALLDYPILTGALLQFHTVNYQQAVTYIASIPTENRTGVVSIPTGNTAPVITMPANYIIPKSTPFVLTGTAIDAENDGLTYTWEGTDIGGDKDHAPDATTLTNTEVGPFSRTYAPAITGTRTFPILSGILDGTNTARADKLPSVGFTLHYNLTVRDNHVLAGNGLVGGVSYGSSTVTVDGNSGPFVITNDKAAGLLNLTGTKLAGSLQTITWSVNNTNVAPINCTLVDIFLSTDGGLTFPATPLLASALNIGTAIVTLPAALNTQTARIKVAASSSQGIPTSRVDNTLAGTNTPNIFFDISNVDFSISTTPLPVTLASFDVNMSGTNGALLKWETTAETNNAGFDIEMSTNAKLFNKVGYVEGKGDSQVSHLYNYTLSNLSGGLYYFRLKQLDFDGKFEYSTIKALLIRNADDAVSIYPNPGNGKMKINTGLHKNDAFSIQILNEKGQKVMTLPSGKQYGNGYELDASFLGAGLYFIKLQGGNFVENLKFVKF